MDAALALSIILAALLGFASRRSNVCTVKAVMEVVTTGRGFMLLSFLQIALWVMFIDCIFYWADGADSISGVAVQISVWPFIGGFIFGVGAAMNAGCAFSTLNRLGSGNLAMLATLVGFFSTSVILIASPLELPTAPAVEMPALLMRRQDVTLLATFAVSLWGAHRVWKLWTGREPDKGLTARLLSARYRLSTGAALIGISAGLLFGLQGKWHYTSTLESLAQQHLNAAPGPTLAQISLFAAIVIGVGLSVVQSGTFHLRLPNAIELMRHGAGGMMMGAGAALIPGGNDVLVLHALPLLLPHAFIAFGGIIAGIYLPILAMKLLGQTLKRLDCSGDICREN